MSMASELMLLGQTALAGVLGGLIGLEREYKGKSAGLRTHMMVAASSALLVGVARLMVSDFMTETPGTIRTDPIRAIEAVAVGVSFLGAGTIFRRGEDTVTGLTTAASMWLVAAIGISVAVEKYVLSIGVTVLVLIVLVAIRFVEYVWIGTKDEPDYRENSSGDGGD